MLSEEIQELLGSPLLTEKDVAALLGPILRKRPCLILLALSLLIRRLLLPEIGPDAHNIALVYSFCLDRMHAGIVSGLSIALKIHAILLLRAVIAEGHLRFGDQCYSLSALMKHKAALLIIFKTLTFTPWLSKGDVAILMQAPIIKRLRADEKLCLQQEQFTKQTNFVTASELIINIVQQHYFGLYKKYSAILYAIKQNYKNLFDAIESAENASRFQNYLHTVQIDRVKSSQRIANLGPYFKWRYYRDQLMEQESHNRTLDQPTIIKTVMTIIHGFAEDSKAKNFQFYQHYNTFLQNMLQISSNTLPLESELKKHEEVIETLLIKNIRIVGVFLPIDTIKKCHDMLVLAGLIRQDVLNCSGTVLFLLEISCNSI